MKKPKLAFKEKRKSNKVKPNKSLMSFASNTDDLSKILEKGTVYTYCN